MKQELSVKKIIEKIDEAIVAEELAIPLYTAHIKQSFFWSDLSQDKQKKITLGLKTLEKDSKNHVKLLKKVKKIYSKNKKK